MKIFSNIIAFCVLSLFLFMKNPSLAEQVNREWVNRYNGPDSLWDSGTAIDIEGNIFVTGRTQTQQGERIVTLKYSPEGSTLWSTIANGRQTAGIAVDGGGNSYITAMAQTGNYLTIKYNAEGIQLWSMIAPGTIFPTSIALDNSNNVYVTGSGMGNKITTVKYNSNGVQQWIANFQNNPNTGPAIGNDIVTDVNGNVYITGYSHNGSNYDFTTIKYNTAGVQQWSAFYNGTSNGTDFGYSIALDDQNNVYITGGSEGTGTGFDYATIKYNAGGAQKWAARYNGPGNYTDLPKGVNTIAVANGKVYVTGRSIGANFNFDYATLQYNTGGALIWVQRYDGPAGGEDDANALALDNDANVYVTGLSYSSYSGTDYLTIKYEKNGTLSWVQRYDGTAGSADAASAIAVDDNANVYVTRLSDGGATSFDIATVKYGKDIFGTYEGVAFNPLLEMLEFTDESSFRNVREKIIKNLREFKGDNWNTEGLLELLQGPTFPVGKLKNTLIAYSPLSDKVLEAVLNQNLAPGMVKEIFINNTSFTDNIENKINESNLPAGIKNEILMAGDTDIIVENKVLDEFENQLNFHSLRKEIEKQEGNFLRAGGDPADSMNPDNFYVQDEIWRTFFNPLLEVKIAGVIYKHLDESIAVAIYNNDIELLNVIRSTNSIPKHTPPSTEPENGLPISECEQYVPKNINVFHVGSDAPDPPPCKAGFTFVGIGSNSISFTGIAGGTEPITYYWNFGDGYGSFDQNPVHQYYGTYNYTVTLTIVDDDGDVCTHYEVISIGSCNLSWSYSTNDLVVYCGSSVSGTIAPVSYSWNFDDGSTLGSFSPIHTYLNPGTYHVCLTIVDGVNCTKTVCKDVTVHNPSGTTGECCDKNDRDRANAPDWTYASNRKGKAVLSIRNFVFDHYIVAKTKNYQSFVTILGKTFWTYKKADYIAAYCTGTLYKSNETFLYWQTECDAVAVSPVISLSDSGNNESWIQVGLYYFGNANSDRIFVKQHSVVSNHIIEYSGTQYSPTPPNLFLTEDCD